MGGAKSAQALLAKPELPANWLVYDYDEVSVRSFLFQIDFYVYFPHPRMIEAFGRAILEALASGCVVILPHISWIRLVTRRSTVIRETYSMW